jgi:hypothetical protein
MRHGRGVLAVPVLMRLEGWCFLLRAGVLFF